MRNTHKKSNLLLKRASANGSSIRQEPKRASQQSKPSQRLGSKGLCYYNRKVNTEAQQIRLSQTKPCTRKLYMLPKSRLDKSQKLARKSHSREIQDSKILDGKSFDYANRFTLTQFNLNDLRKESGCGFSNNLVKKKSRKTNQKLFQNTNLLVESGTTKKYRSPYDKQARKDIKTQGMGPIEIKSIPKARIPRRVATEVNQNQQTMEINREKLTQTIKETRNVLVTPENIIQIVEQIGQGTFGKVYKAVLASTGETVAVKKVLQDKKYKSRQLEIINMLKSDFTMKTIHSYLSCEQNNGQKQQYLNIIMQHYDCNLYQYLGRHRDLSNTLRLKVLLYQIFRGLLYIHSLGICHRDIKPHNMLVKNGRVCICDFGSAKILLKNQPNLSYICSRCYRAPQLIFGSVLYTTQIDIWAAGCIILQILNEVPLFIGQNSLDHLVEVIKVMGTPTKNEVISMNPDYDLKQYDFPHIPKKQWHQIFPGTDPKLIDLISKVMRYSPQLRLNAAEVLSHQYFDDVRQESLQKQIKLISKTTGFFQFTPNETKMMANNKKLVPSWYKNVYKKDNYIR